MKNQNYFNLLFERNLKIVHLYQEGVRPERIAELSCQPEGVAGARDYASFRQERGCRIVSHKIGN